jgi:very-short-patch-repair endonuclease
LPNLFAEFEVYKNKKNIRTVTNIIDKLLSIPELTSALLVPPQLSEILDEYRDVCEHGKNRDRLKQSLLSRFSEGVLSLDAKKMLFDWNQTLNKWFIPKSLGQRSIKKQLVRYATGQLDKDQISSTLEDVIEYQSEQTYLGKYEDDMPLYFKRYGRNGSEDWKTIEQIITDTSAIHLLILKHTKDISKATNIKRVLSLQLSDGISTFREMHSRTLITINNLISKLYQQERILYSVLGTSEDILYKQSDNWVNSTLGQLNIWLENLDKLKDWYQWLLVYNKMQAIHISFVADQYKDDNIETTNLLNIFYKSFYKAVIEYIISKEPNLQLFKGKIFNDRIEKYKRLVADFEQLTRKELVAQLAANLPSFTREATLNSEVGILQRNIRNNARGISIRRLFDLIPTLLPRMCPCMLMSPISVAQYIDVDADKFDLIVFDEASQMPTYEAVGAIARGKNVVIVGDPKQMPPTDFFSVNSTDEDNIEMEDLESILDDCLALSMPSKYLLWHYRSKHESLIAFSNSEYYDNKLLTFPSPDNIESKVRFIPVDGHYDKGKSRQNKAEAKAIVDEIVRRLKDEKLRKRSIGVVTFSSVQQSLIEDLLSDMLMLDSQLESLALECEEPIFIKNLENVQGDERDVILFSVGYGPDKAGRVSMNFGPLNREGGERRLNVAVSRARYEMIIYSTLRSDQIDLNRTAAVGVAGLKRFLEYAEKGGKIANRTQHTIAEYSINNLIAGQLEKSGYQVDTNIGCSGYRIDIGIVDTDNPSRYKLGIICDGENYRRAKMVRDREIVQNSVLRMLGWKILKIWTLDWWENPDAVLKSIEEALNTEEKNTIEIEAVVPLKNVEPKSEMTVDIPSPTEGIEYYKPYQISVLIPSPYGSEEFFYPGHRRIILNQIKEIMDAEAPISKSLLCKRVLAAWGISRLGQRLDSYINELLLSSDFYVSDSDNLAFYWLNEEQYLQYDLFRTGLRDAVDLPPEEVANAMKYVLTDEISLPTTDLSRLSAQLLGFARGGSNVDAAMHRGLVKAIDKGYLKVENGRAVIL